MRHGTRANHSGCSASPDPVALTLKAIGAAVWIIWPEHQVTAEFARDYRAGRRVPTTFDEGKRRYRTRLVYAESKFAARADSV